MTARAAAAAAAGWPAGGAVAGTAVESKELVDWAQRLPAVVGMARAKELILAARRVPADEALAMGLLNRVVPAAELQAAADELARAIAANGPLAVRAAKEAIDLSGSGEPLDVRLVAERNLYLERVLPSSDRLEALAAFREKRKPDFAGR